eukprot:scaffold453475_cov13-Prasinocladus_malaysianus.AAC.1
MAAGIGRGSGLFHAFLGGHCSWSRQKAIVFEESMSYSYTHNIGGKVRLTLGVNCLLFESLCAVLLQEKAKLC